MSEYNWKYPQTEALKTGWLTVSEKPLHRIYWEEYGNPQGEAVMFLHGGPGGASEPMYSRFFDPKRYRVILFDQRGCGKSLPNAAEDNPAPALADNTTPHLISDIMQLHGALGIEGKMHVFGGSWGSTLALAYGIAHPETVRTLILRGIFLCRRQDMDYFYQGNAVHYAQDANDVSLPGAYMFFPEIWKSYVEAIPAAERGDIVKAYAKRFASIPKTEAERIALTEAAKAWSIWEGVTCYLAKDLKDIGKFAEPEFAKAFARIENHYFMNGGFLGGQGEQNRDQNFILDNLHKISDIPIHIVHGRYDQVCPMFQAEALVAALKESGAKSVSYRLTASGHSMTEPENLQALTEIMDRISS